MIFSLAQIIQLVLQYRYHILFPMMIIEGPIITILAGFLSSLDYFNVFAVYGIAVLGDIFGDGLCYALGRWGVRFMGPWKRYIGMTPERVARLERHFKRHMGKTLITGKLAHGVGAVILTTAGVAKVPFWKYMTYNTIATLPKSLILLLIGFYFGQAYAKISRYLDYTALATISLAVIFTILYLMMRRMSKKYGGSVAD